MTMRPHCHQLWLWSLIDMKAPPLHFPRLRPLFLSFGSWLMAHVFYLVWFPRVLSLTHVPYFHSMSHTAGVHPCLVFSFSLCT